MTGSWGRLHDTWGQGSGAVGKHPGFWELLLMDCGKETKRGWLELTRSDRSRWQPCQMPSAPRTSVRLALGVECGQKQEEKGGPGGWAGEGRALITPRGLRIQPRWHHPFPGSIPTLAQGRHQEWAGWVISPLHDLIWEESGRVLPPHPHTQSL